jgi:hypothetical protein
MSPDFPKHERNFQSVCLVFAICMVHKFINCGSTSGSSSSLVLALTAQVSVIVHLIYKVEDS